MDARKDKNERIRALRGDFCATITEIIGEFSSLLSLEEGRKKHNEDAKSTNKPGPARRRTARASRTDDGAAIWEGREKGGEERKEDVAAATYVLRVLEQCR